MSKLNNKKNICILIITFIIFISLAFGFCKVGNKIVFKYTTNFKINGDEIKSTNDLYKLKNVRKLSLHDFETEKCRDFEYLLQMKYLEELAVTVEEDFTASSPLSVISKCENLKKIYCDGYNQHKIDNLLHFSDMNQLESIWLNFDYIESLDGLQLITSNLKDFHLLGKHSLSNLDFDSLENLEELYISVDLLQKIVVDIPHLKRLVVLSESIDELIISSNCMELETLNINFTDIDVDMLLNLKSLKKIYASKDSFTEDDLSRLQNKGIIVEYNE